MISFLDPVSVNPFLVEDGVKKVTSFDIIFAWSEILFLSFKFGQVAAAKPMIVE